MNGVTDRELAGARFGRYRVTSVLGRGGMGLILAARDERSSDRVAIKTLRRDLCDRRDLLDRFDREIGIAASVATNGTPRLLDSGIDPTWGRYFVMELLEGESLSARLKREQRLGVAETVKIARGVLLILDAVHRAGVIHRDIKPSNIFLERRRDIERVRILDFGVSGFVDGASIGGLTLPGQILGTPAYMAPEQSMGESDQRSDVYGVGAVTHACLCGGAPQPRTRSWTHRARPSADENLVEGLSALGLPPDLSHWIGRCLAPQRDDRFQSAEEALDALDALEMDETVLSDAADDSLLRKLAVAARARALAPQPDRTTAPGEVVSRKSSRNAVILPTDSLIAPFGDLTPSARGPVSSAAERLARRSISGEISISQSSPPGRPLPTPSSGSIEEPTGSRFLPPPAHVSPPVASRLAVTLALALVLVLALIGLLVVAR